MAGGGTGLPTATTFCQTEEGEGLVGVSVTEALRAVFLKPFSQVGTPLIVWRSSTSRMTVLVLLMTKVARVAPALNSFESAAVRIQLWPRRTLGRPLTVKPRSPKTVAPFWRLDCTDHCWL